MPNHLELRSSFQKTGRYIISQASQKDEINIKKSPKIIEYLVVDKTQ